MTFEEVVIGEEIDCRELRITPEMQEVYLEVLQNESSIYIKGNQSQPPIAHPVVILNHALPSEWIGSFKEHIHAKNYVQFINPTRVGEKIFVRSKVYEKFIKRGRKYITIEITCSEEDGLEIMRCRWTETHGRVED